MQKTYMKDLQSYRRSIAWGVANPQIIPPPQGDQAGWSSLTLQLHGLTGIVADIADAAAQQETQGRARKLDASSEGVLRAHLRGELHAITQVAQALRKEIPGIGSMKMPPQGIAVEGFLASADSLIGRAATYQSVLVEHGLAPDFIAQVQQATAALRASIDGRGSANASLRGATKRLAEGVALGRKYVTLMDAALTKQLRGKTAKLAEWKSAKRVVATATSGSSDTAASMLAGAPQASPALVTQAAEVKTA